MTTKLPTALLEPCWGNRRIDRRVWSVIGRDLFTESEGVR